MSEALIPFLPSEAAPTLEEFAAALGLSTSVAAKMIAHKDTAAAIQEETKARALLAQPAIANMLIRIVNGKDDKDAMTAAGLLLKLSGNLKAPSVNVRLSFDQMMKAATTVEAGPLAGLTQIKESAVIDADMEDDADG